MPAGNRSHTVAAGDSYTWPLAGLALVSAGVAWVTWNWKPVLPEAPTIIKPLTNNGGFEGGPAVSPDGKMVAFSSNGDRRASMDLYVKLLDSSQPLKLTQRARGQDVAGLVS